tara:strand:+ start:2640 stop:2933 length:294 start_codon:yes stop_codon:yes gene_type:complete
MECQGICMLDEKDYCIGCGRSIKEIILTGERYKMRDKLLKAWQLYAEGNKQKHLANIEVYLNQSVGIGEHSDILEALEQEGEKVSYWDDQLHVISKL